MTVLRRLGLFQSLTCYGLICIVIVAWLAFGSVAALAAKPVGAELGIFLKNVPASELVPSADAYGALEQAGRLAPVLKQGERIATVFLNSDWTNSTGYSGKPIQVLIALDDDAIVRGARLVKHAEPIVLVGIPEKRMTDFIAGYIGLNIRDQIGASGADARPVDLISGATVTVLVIHDSILRAGWKVLHAIGPEGDGSEPAAPVRSVKMMEPEARDWLSLLGDGSVRKLSMSVADVNALFDRDGPDEAKARPEQGLDSDTFIDIVIAPVSVPTIGYNLLGAREYALLQDRLNPGQEAILVAGNGRYSFKGSGYVRGGIFDRFELIQGEDGVRFKDKHHKRLGNIEAEGAPHFQDVGVFIVPETMAFNPAEPWVVQLLISRPIGPIKKAFSSVQLSYNLPGGYVSVVQPAVPAATVVTGDEAEADENPLWKRIWQARVLDVVILSIALAALSGLFFFQTWFVQRPKLLSRIRLGFLLFVVIWLGFFQQAQLSVVNVLTFGSALMGDFRWDFFLMEPLVFILWCSVAVSLLFWGRGPFCGWLCPFGALQELLNKAAKALKIPQISLPWGLHERLWPIKYILFLGLFGLSLSSFALAETYAEIEPFKTSIVLGFAREWPYVAWAVGLLGIGLFIERFFCRYLCPLGAALAIPGRMRMFDWLKRHKECGKPCQHCADECMVQAIHPEGPINPNECLYCMHCQVVYVDDQVCPPMVERRVRREKRDRLSEAAKSKADG